MVATSAMTCHASKKVAATTRILFTRNPYDLELWMWGFDKFGSWA